MLVSILRQFGQGFSCTMGWARCGIVEQRLYHNSFLRIHPNVKQALSEGRPIVALESTIITHGMPYPQNISMAKDVEDIVRTNGSVPATVGILRGKIHVGLCEEDLLFLAKSKDCVKVSRRDLPYVLSKGLSGGSTVSATMIAAKSAGIPIFVTGGIGGVHRDGEKTMDISADLTELGRTPVAVISAGVKSILDIGRTLEYLETEGVCVSTFGNSQDFPAFFTPKSGFQAPCNVRNEEEAAQLIACSLELKLGSGLLIAVPIPPEHSVSGQEIEEAVQQALKEARLKHTTGKEATPFLLKRVKEITGGKSLESNLALIKNNAQVGSRIAVALSRIWKPEGGLWNELRGLESSEISPVDSRPVVVGGIYVDFIAKTYHNKIVYGGQTNPGQVQQSFGGVGRNVADCLSRLGQKPLFISAVGQDAHSKTVFQYCTHMDMRGVKKLEDQRTATYCAVITNNGELSFGLGDIDIHCHITDTYVSQFADCLRHAPLICIDGNVPLATIQYVCDFAKQNSIPVCYEPTDVDKAAKPFLSNSWKSLTYISPNLKELISINLILGHPVHIDIPSELDDIIDKAIVLSLPLLEYLHCVIITLGANGVLLCGYSSGGALFLYPKIKVRQEGLSALHYPAAPISPKEIVNVSGAGDSFIAGFLAGILAEMNTDICVRMGLLAARLSLQSHGPISNLISVTTVSPQQVKAISWIKPKTWKIDPSNGKKLLM
uniref:Carbohydrate kinase PfkB domain-containing protein n=1 Tax=Leptobrachium leishanense TaxID=445787 RepID=A0A8C5PMM1_9ANUR